MIMQRDIRRPRVIGDRSRCYIFGGGNAQAGATVTAAGISSAAQITAAQAAASAQEHAADVAAQTQRHMYDTTRGDLLPYNTGGQGDFSAYNDLITGSPSEMQARLQAMPGFQFTQTQGLKAVQNSAAARGLGVSGAALKGAATYATGLADTTFGQQANRLLAGAQLGESAASQTGQAGTAAAGGIANAQIGAGNAAAGGFAGIANGLSNFANTAGAVNYLGMYGGGGNGSQGYATDPQYADDPSLPPF